MRGPAALEVGPKELLVFVKNMAGRRQCARGRVGRSAPRAAIRADQAQIAHVIGGADGREVFKLLVDVALPEIRRLEDVHVAIENFETVIGHRSPPGPRLRKVRVVPIVQTVQAVRARKRRGVRSRRVRVCRNIFRCLRGVYVRASDFDFGGFFLKQKGYGVCRLVAPAALDGLDKTLFSDVRQR